MNLTAETNLVTRQLQAIDDELSKRSIALDPSGYFIIYVERQQNLICAKHYSNIINDKGLAVDPETGKPIPAKGKVDRQAMQLFIGRTAKELCVRSLKKHSLALLHYLTMLHI